MEINYDYKDEIIENLKEALHGTVRAKGRRYLGNRRYEINESSILTKLIQEAGRWCENYASDLFIQWKYRIDSKIEDGTIETTREIFAFRENGVDHKEWYEINKDKSRYYRAVWCLDIEVNNDEIQMILHK